MQIAVLMTCHNRREITLRCLESLYAQKLPNGVSFNVFLVDDGCTDGTGPAVKATYPDVNVIQGDGSLFWCNGMRLAWDHAAKEDPDFYLWLNDDVQLLEGAIERLLSCWLSVAKGGVSLESASTINHELSTDNHGDAVIIVGSCCDPETGELTYGGQRRLGRHPGKVKRVAPQQTPVECDTFEGNIVLVPRAVYLRIGMLDSFSHAMGDTDYGYRARNAGCLIWISIGYQAECEGNLAENVFENHSLNFGQQFQVLLKRIPPRDWWVFLKAHAGVRAFYYFPFVYLRFFVRRR